MPESRKKRGRPPVDLADKRTPIGIPFSPNEREVLREAAAVDGIPLTQLIRDAANREAAAVLRRIG